MIDTLGIEFASVKIPSSIYLGWDDGGHHRKRGYVVSWYGFTRRLSNGASIQYSYYPNIKSGLQKIEFSLPHIIFGNNVQMIKNIADAVETANSMMPIIPDIPKVDLWAGILYRLDVCYNFQVNELVPWFIKALLPLERPYCKTHPYTNQGVQYQNKQIVFRFYDKARERRDKNDLAGAQIAKGILRAEVELKKAYIKKLTGCKEPTLRSISENWAYDVLEKELEKLNLLGCSIGTVDSTFNILRENYGSWEALALIGLLKIKIDYPSIELVAQDADLHPNSIGRHLQKKFAANGIPFTLTDNIKPLPPLVIDRGSDTG